MDATEFGYDAGVLGGTGAEGEHREIREIGTLRNWLIVQVGIQ